MIFSFFAELFISRINVLLLTSIGVWSFYFRVNQQNVILFVVRTSIGIVYPLPPFCLINVFKCVMLIQIDYDYMSGYQNENDTSTNTNVNNEDEDTTQIVDRQRRLLHQRSLRRRRRRLNDNDPMQQLQQPPDQINGHSNGSSYYTIDTSDQDDDDDDNDDRQVQDVDGERNNHRRRRQQYISRHRQFQEALDRILTENSTLVDGRNGESTTSTSTGNNRSRRNNNHRFLIQQVANVLNWNINITEEYAYRYFVSLSEDRFLQNQNEQQQQEQNDEQQQQQQQLTPRRNNRQPTSVDYDNNNNNNDDNNEHDQDVIAVARQSRSTVADNVYSSSSTSLSPQQLRNENYSVDSQIIVVQNGHDPKHQQPSNDTHHDVSESTEKSVARSMMSKESDKLRHPADSAGNNGIGTSFGTVATNQSKALFKDEYYATTTATIANDHNINDNSTIQNSGNMNSNLQQPVQQQHQQQLQQQQQQQADEEEQSKLIVASWSNVDRDLLIHVIVTNNARPTANTSDIDLWVWAEMISLQMNNKTPYEIYTFWRSYLHMQTIDRNKRQQRQQQRHLNRQQQHHQQQQNYYAPSDSGRK